MALVKRRFEMANGLPTWEEWNNLTEDQRNYEQHRVLINLDGRLKVVEKRKLRDTAAATGAGFVAGLGGLLGLKWLMK